MPPEPPENAPAPVGFDLASWRPPAPLEREPLAGRWCRLEPLAPDAHSEPLYDAYREDTRGRGWTYLPYGPFATAGEFREWIERVSATDDPLFYAIRDEERGRWCGMASYLRIAPELGTLEVGHIHYAPALRRTRAGTEAMYLMMKNAFDRGFRRYEWKCDALNAASMRAARRYGFRFDGLFRQAAVYKGRNRDTAWFSVLDRDWPVARARFERWLDPSGFDARSPQIAPLGAREKGDAAFGLRDADSGDLPTIVGLLADDPLGQTREQAPPPLLQSYRDAFDSLERDARNQLLVATEAERVVGVLQLTFLPGLTYRGRERALVEGVRVSRDVRGRGVGEQLMRAAIERARALGCHMVQLTTDRSRPEAQRFYERLGFTPSHVGMKLTLE